MKNKPGERQSPTELRQNAERLLAMNSATQAGSVADEKKLMHELQVHQIELELQNEELRCVQAQLELSRALYFDLYDLAPVGYLAIRENGFIQEANLTAAGLLGLSRGDLIQQPIARFISPPDHDIYFLCCEQLPSTGESRISELRLIGRGGIEFWARLAINQSQAEAGMAVFRVMISDITKNKQAEQALLEAKNLAEECTRVKSEFLANMSHEIRTPMAVIVNFSELMLKHDVSPQVRQYLQRIRKAMNNLLGILNDILDFSKIESGCMRMESGGFNLDDLLDNLGGLFSLQAQEKRIVFNIEANTDVPRKLIGDVRGVQQILTNLLSNALKFTEQGTVTLKVELVSREANNTILEFHVEDTGIGISKSDLGKLFLPFSQVDGSITRRYGGTGLGLAISQRLLQLMESAIHVESMPGMGSRFSFKLTLGVAEG